MSLEGVPEGVHSRQKKILKDMCRRTGLNQPSRILLWGRTTDLNQDWDDLKDFLKGNRFLPTQDGHPLITNQLWVGDNWFSCESHGSEGFGIFVRAVWNRLHESRGDEQVLVGDEQDDAEQDDEVEQPPVDLVVECQSGGNDGRGRGIQGNHWTVIDLVFRKLLGPPSHERNTDTALGQHTFFTDPGIIE